MSTPAVFILLPFLVSVVLFFVQKRTRLVMTISIATCTVLVLFAFFQNFGEVWKIGPISIEIRTNLAIMGRAFSLTNQDKFFLAFLYFSSALWFGGTRGAKVSSRFIPIGLAIVSILTAALAVEPFIYSAILVEIAVLVSVPLLVEPGIKAGNGILRFIVYQSLAMPFILFGGWLLGGIQASPSDTTRLLQSIIFLGIGFALWLAIVPFQSWVPRLSFDLKPYISGFLLGLFPIVTMLIMVDFISGLVWLRESAYLQPSLRLVGAIMVVTTGIWAIIEKDLRRFFGYTVLLESGLALLLVSLQSDAGVSVLYLSFIPRMFALALMALSLTILSSENDDLDVESISGMVRKYPFASFTLVFSMLSVAGVPLLGGFPVRLSLLEMLANGGHPVTIWVLLGMGAYLFAVIRIFQKITMPASAKWQRHESNGQVALLLIGVVILIIFGLFPNLLAGLLRPLFVNLPILR